MNHALEDCIFDPYDPCDFRTSEIPWGEGGAGMNKKNSRERGSIINFSGEWVNSRYFTGRGVVKSRIFHGDRGVNSTIFQGEGSKKPIFCRERGEEAECLR